MAQRGAGRGLASFLAGCGCLCRARGLRCAKVVTLCRWLLGGFRRGEVEVEVEVARPKGNCCRFETGPWLRCGACREQRAESRAGRLGR